MKKITLFLVVVFCLFGITLDSNATISRSTSIDYTNDFIGKNNTGTGAIKKLDTDLTSAFTYLQYLHTSYAGSSEPLSPQTGMIWYDTGNAITKVYSGSMWVAVSQSTGISNVVEDTTPQLGGDLDLNQNNISLDPTPTSDHTWNGEIETQTAGEDLVIGDVCYFKSDGKMWKADADDSSTTAGRILMATGTIAADDTGTFLKEGFIRDDTWDWSTIGSKLYVSATAGNPTETKPSPSGDFVRIIGYAHSADIVAFYPEPGPYDNSPKVLDGEVASTTVGNTAVETTLYSISVPANTLSTSNALRLTIYGTLLQNADKNIQVDLKYGSTTVATISSLSFSNESDTVGFTLTALLSAQGATDRQYGQVSMATGLHYDNGDHYTSYGTASEDSTGALNLVVTITWSGANASATLTSKYVILEKIDSI